MKLTKSVLSMSLAFLMVLSSVSAQGQGEMKQSAVAPSDLEGMTLKEVLSTMDSLKQNERAKLLSSLEQIAEQTKTDIAFLKNQVVAAQAKVDFIKGTKTGEEQQMVQLEIPKFLLVLAAGGAFTTLLFFAHHKAAAYGSTDYAARVRVAAGRLSVFSLIVTVSLLSASAYGFYTADYPVENLKKLLSELKDLETKIDAEVALIQILKVRYGI